MNNNKARRAFHNYIFEQLESYDTRADYVIETYDNHAEYVKEWNKGICDYCAGCDCIGACGTDLCIDKLIEFYGGEGDEDN